MEGVCGIDLGLGGGLAIRGTHGTVVCPFERDADGELDCVWLAEWLKLFRHQFSFAVCEYTNAFKGQAAASSLKFGKTIGRIEGIFLASKIPLKHVRPMDWQKKIGIVRSAKRDPDAIKNLDVSRKETKTQAAELVRQLFPNLYPQLVPPRGSRPHEGMVDALLIAECFWRENATAP